MLSSSSRMKKWSGGITIVALALILIFSYTLMGTTHPNKEHLNTAYDFFNAHPPDKEKKDKGTTPIPSHLVKHKAAKQPSSKRPLLVNVEGLGDLYAPNNVSAEDSMPLLLWPHMRLLLSRPDALPGTAQGVKEASVAWKDLLSTIEQHKANYLDNETCPDSLSVLDLSKSRSRRILEIPCGLVQDSSITLLGIPNEHNGSFQIDLMGSQIAEESDPPIVLHYNVCLTGDNMTEEPLIVQNTWTSDNGWGKEAKCPEHGSANAIKVDGLVLCNEQTVSSNVKENLNLTITVIMANASERGSHAIANFPFVEGSPFAATLWVGLDGFHMTVNGRHETSFTFREKLEPWSVTGVQVAGNVDILSAIAKGLPVSEDHDLVVHIDHLKAPAIKKKRLVMLVGIFSTGNNFERRMALRRSWMQYEAIRAGDVAVRFFIGLHKNNQVNLELWKEAQAYGDTQLMPFVDYYGLITLKTIAICLMGTKILPAKYIMKTDDDAFVRIDEVFNGLKGKPSNGLLYGRISFDSSPHRDKDSKWYINSEEWPHDSYPPWAHGPGYIISRDIAKFIVQGHQGTDLQLFKLEDVAMGIWIEQFKNSGRKVHYENEERFNNGGCESNYILAHYQTPRLVLCLWENLQKEQKPICCE